MNQTRFGAYGIVQHNGKVLLSQKKSGPYLGKWGLPGGSIDYGESPEETLRREILEETGMQASDFTLIDVLSVQFKDFHQIGIIYKVGKFRHVPDAQPEEKFDWFSDFKPEAFTPFATLARKHFG